ncbi:hypothetical protein PFFCH_05011 [Plasmodium falciparum FCH/4]|uniref:Glyceraldehyde 3-phosphate dehydrogenase NAD(P) binding domain-containing protein n=1 Tax=Plasmodium falciparum FCH/4 TaxID=1036724 RepID=A0A024VI22_PLAFA|nr:hypothetical protein PFFCH_05011 [Plasmodium falciparum FCH/4]
MAVTKLGINGFGRIGRLVFRAAFGRKDIVSFKYLNIKIYAYICNILCL